MCLSMAPKIAYKLLELISSRNPGSDTQIWDAIPTRQTTSKFIPEVCEAMYDSLQEFNKGPATKEEWTDVENGFQKRWNFPGYYDALYGKHILIKAPPNSETQFFHYKGFNSIVLMPLVDHNYFFRYIDVECNGVVSDGGFVSFVCFLRTLRANCPHLTHYRERDVHYITGYASSPRKPTSRVALLINITLILVIYRQDDGDQNYGNYAI
ncbi:hypothetical protein PR048_005487 [Dryococelus australis]|uniref:Uncharacterized protein n=1 Tax=Dryococelus australis TaxID=614101 RepID=A0ABQ9I8G8_9NEOP|nr:hypothetical protein PR048_005487 [Dryococelus australis]